MPTKVWQPGEAVTAADFNPMVQEQVVPTFATAAARDAAIPSPKVGQFCYQDDPGILLQFTDKSLTPGWHKPWDQPWGEIKYFLLPDFRFGNWTGYPGSDWYFPVRRRMVKVTFDASIYKDIDGYDAHTVVRTNVSNGSAWVPYADALVTIHQGWVGRPAASVIVDTSAWQGVWYHLLSTGGTAVTQWVRLYGEDIGPAPMILDPGTGWS